jgi:hypothetical protein
VGGRRVIVSSCTLSGVKDGAKLLLLEKHALASVEPKQEPVIMDESMMKACEAVGCVRPEVDKLSAKVKRYSSCLSFEVTVLYMHSDASTLR